MEEYLRERAEVDTLVAQIADENEKERKVRRRGYEPASLVSFAR